MRSVHVLVHACNTHRPCIYLIRSAEVLGLCVMRHSPEQHARKTNQADCVPAVGRSFCGAVLGLYSSHLKGFPQETHMAQRSCLQALREAMPPVARIESDADVLLRAVENLPQPLCKWPLPPLIVTEKGESLDLFAARSAPDFFTSLQVRRCCLLVLAADMLWEIPVAVCSLSVG